MAYLNDVLVAIVLVDGYLENHGKGVRLQVVHSARFKDYVEWKHKLLKKFKPSPIHYCKSRYSFWRFVTSIHPIFKQIKDKFYVGNKKKVPEDINQLLTSPFGLANMVYG